MKITVSLLRDLLHDYDKEEISISRFAEILNETTAAWISVKDRKPQKAKPILIFNGNWIGVGWYKKHQDDKVKWSDETGEYIYPEPAFWRELPEPPKQ